MSNERAAFAKEVAEVEQWWKVCTVGGAQDRD